MPNRLANERNESDLLVSIGFAHNRLAVVMLVLTSLIAVLAFTVGPSVSARAGSNAAR
jgi:lipopolysaccharide export LptBFGC system permease protein LptF